MVPEESYSPFWKNFGKRLGAFDPNPVESEIEVGQRAAEKSNEFGTTHAKRQQTLRRASLCATDLPVHLDACGHDDCVFHFQPLPAQINRCLCLQRFDVEFGIDPQTLQWAVEKSTMRRKVRLAWSA